MNEFSNDAATPAIGGETFASDDSHMAMPSHADIERGAARATWGADPSSSDPAQHVQAESAADFGLERAAEALGLPAETIDGARSWLAGETEFSGHDDEAHNLAAQTELRELWGDKLVPNLLAIDKYLESLPGNAGAVFKVARDGNGRALANDPATLQRMLGAATARGAVITGGTLKEQIAAIERTMKTDRKAYDRNELMQARYRELLTMRSRS